MKFSAKTIMTTTVGVSLFILSTLLATTSIIFAQELNRNNNNNNDDIWNIAATSPSSGGFVFFDDVNSKHENVLSNNHPDSRQAKSLALNCADYDPCPPHGFCLNNVCVCDSEPLLGYWAGSDCKDCGDGFAGVDCMSECAGGSCNQCSGHGTCNQGIAGDGTCTCVSDAANGFFDGTDCASCKSGYFGEKCDKSCPGADVGALPCFGRGECYSSSSGAGLCACITGYGTDTGCKECDATSYGPNCEFRCSGYIAGTSTIPAVACSGHGLCKSGSAGDGSCQCDSQYGTFDCSKRCPSIDANGCSGHGLCFDGNTGNASCECSGNFAQPSCSYCTADFSGPNCTALCPNPNTGVKSQDAICSNTGICVAVDEYTGSCTCEIGYRSSTNTLGFDFCDIACPGSPPCSGHGTCVVDPADSTKSICKCFADPVNGYWVGDLCDSCSVDYNQSNAASCTLKCPVANGKICNGQGFCAYGKCYCSRGVLGFDYCGTACELASAPGAMIGLSCAGCTCVYCPEQYKYGPDCAVGVFDDCPGMTTTDPIVPCNGNGRCSEGIHGTGQCECYLGWAGPGCASSCPTFNGMSCGGGGRGWCNSTSDGTIFCNCVYGFAGTSCQIDCPRTADNVCSGHGICNSGYLGDGTCKCALGWTGKSCNVRCACDTDHGNCDHAFCADYSATQTCSTCLCNGNFTGLCDVCKSGYQGLSCEGQCVQGTTVARTCTCKPLWATPSCSVYCPHDTSGRLCGNRGNCSGGNDQTGTCTCVTDALNIPLYYGAACTVYCTVDLCKAKGLYTPQCNVLTGACECKDDATGHWFGSTCSECLEGYFGAQCAAACQCSNHGGCDKATGVCNCFQDFTRGFYSGSACDVCSDNYIGDNCERANVLYTRITQNLTISNANGYPGYRSKMIPASNVFMMDERLDIAYAGSFPMLQLSNSIANVGNLYQVANSSTASFLEGKITYGAGNTTMNPCYNEVAYSFPHEDYLYFLMHPQMQCNLTARLLRRLREDNVGVPVSLDFSRMTKVWQMPDTKWWPQCSGCLTWGNRTARIVWSDSISETKRLSREVATSTLEPAVSFILGEPDPADDSVYLGGALLVRINIGALSTGGILGATAAGMLPTNFIPSSLAVRGPSTTNAEQSEAMAVSGSLISTSAGDTWEVYVFTAAGTTLVPDPVTELSQASIRSKIECFQKVADKTLGQRTCQECTAVPAVNWFGLGLALGITTPDSAIAGWIRPWSEVLNNGLNFMFPFGDTLATATCALARIDALGNAVNVNTGAISQWKPGTLLNKRYVPYFADSKITGSVSRSMVVDASTKLQHHNIVVYGKASYMVKYLMNASSFSIFGVYTLDVMSAVVVGLGTPKTKPEEFSRLVVDEHARILYGTVDQQSEFRLASFLLYDVLSLNPNLADQRGGTVIQVIGHGFKQILDPLLGPLLVKILFPIKCQFGGAEIVPANYLSDTLVNCTTLKVSEEAAVSSCEGQTVEISLFDTKFFTDNQIPLKRVQAAKIESAAYPDRGPLEGGNLIIFTGTGFIDSTFGRCRFYSNNTIKESELLFAPMTFINVTAASCIQPPATIPSPKFSFIDVSLDGQLFMETTPPLYTIVGRAANISAPLVVSMPATLPSTFFSVATEVVDNLLSWVGTLDTVVRTICLTNEYTEEVACQPDKYSWRYPEDSFFERGIDGGCRPNVITIANLNKTLVPDPQNSLLKVEQYCRDVLPGVGVYLWNDLNISNPRTGSFTYTWHAYAGNSYLEKWEVPTTLIVVPGAPYALQVSNRNGLLKPGTFSDGQAFQPFPEIIVVDEVGNIVDTPPSTIEVTVRAFYMWDINDTLGGYKELTEKMPTDSNFITFRSIYPTYLHGATHFFNFTSRSPALIMVQSPPLRTVPCPNPKTSYKIPFTGLCGFCPPSGAECYGNETVVLLPGYWRENSTTNIYSCPGGSSTCLGSYGAGEGQFCTEGYQGPLCSLCIKDWGKVGATSCQPCPPLGTSVGLILLLMVAVIIALTGWTISVLRTADVTDLSVVMRTVVNHMQVTGKLPEFKGARFGGVAQGAMETQSSSSSLSFSGLSALSCLVASAGGDYQMVFTGYMMMPLISILMAGLVLCTVRILKLKPVLQDKVRADIIEEVKNMPAARIGLLLEQYPWYWVLVTTFSLTMFVLYQTLITQATAVLTCTPLVIAPGVTQQYLKVDMSIECDTAGNHKFKTFAYMGAIGYGFGIPAAFVFTYKFMGNRIGNRDLVGQMFMFLIGGYKEDFWYWQAVIMVRKLVLVLVITFIATNDALQLYGGMWTLLWALVLQIWFEPCERDSFNQVETLSLASITVTLNLALMALWKEMPDAIFGLVVVIFIGTNLGVFAGFGYFMYEPIRDTVLQKLDMVKGILENLKKPKEVKEDPDEARRRRRFKVEDDMAYDESVGASIGMGGRGAQNAFKKRGAQTDTNLADFSQLEMQTYPRNSNGNQFGNEGGDDNNDDVLGIGSPRHPLSDQSGSGRKSSAPASPRAQQQQQQPATLNGMSSTAGFEDL